MTGAQLARAIADLCSTKPDLDAKLAAILAKWLKDALGKVSTSEDFRHVAANGRVAVISLYLKSSALPRCGQARQEVRPPCSRSSDPVTRCPTSPYPRFGQAPIRTVAKSFSPSTAHAYRGRACAV